MSSKSSSGWDLNPPQRPRQTLSSSSVRPRSPSLSQYWANFLAHRRGFSLRRRYWRSGRASRSLSTPLESTSSLLKCQRSATSGLEDSADSGAAGGRSRGEEEEAEEDEGWVEEVGGLGDGDGESRGGVLDALVERDETKNWEIREKVWLKIYNQLWIGFIILSFIFQKRGFLCLFSIQVDSQTYYFLLTMRNSVTSSVAHLYFHLILFSILHHVMKLKKLKNIYLLILYLARKVWFADLLTTDLFLFTKSRYFWWLSVKMKTISLDDRTLSGELLSDVRF